MACERRIAYEGDRIAFREFLSVAEKDDYDAVYYFIGKRDFDQSDPRSIEIVVEMIIEKGTEDETDPYISGLTEEDFSRLYEDGDELPPNVALRAADRKVAENMGKIRGMTYIPDSEKFVHLLDRLGGSLSQKRIDEIERQLESERHSDEVLAAVPRTWYTGYLERWADWMARWYPLSAFLFPSLVILGTLLFLVLLIELGW